MDISDISSLIIEDFEAFKKIVGIDNEKAIEEYLEYNAFYDIDIRVIKNILEDYKQKNL